MFWYSRMGARILLHQLPFHCLFKTVSKQLINIPDRTGVERISGNPMYPNEVHKWVALDDNSLVSMNMWGFRPDIFNEMQAAFVDN